MLDTLIHYVTNILQYLLHHIWLLIDNQEPWTKNDLEPRPHAAPANDWLGHTLISNDSPAK